jgi:hypothetical protein
MNRLAIVSAIAKFQGAIVTNYGKPVNLIILQAWAMFVSELLEAVNEGEAVE